jgi:hypothetical protein
MKLPVSHSPWVRTPIHGAGDDGAIALYLLNDTYMAQLACSLHTAL